MGAYLHHFEYFAKFKPEVVAYVLGLDVFHLNVIKDDVTDHKVYMKALHDYRRGFKKIEALGPDHLKPLNKFKIMFEEFKREKITHYNLQDIVKKHDLFGNMTDLERTACIKDLDDEFFNSYSFMLKQSFITLEQEYNLPAPDESEVFGLDESEMNTEYYGSIWNMIQQDLPLGVLFEKYRVRIPCFFLPFFFLKYSILETFNFIELQYIFCIGIFRKDEFSTSLKQKLARNLVSKEALKMSIMAFREKKRIIERYAFDVESTWFDAIFKINP